MKPTLLELTQQILSDMSSDEVNSISDTAESLQVANSIKEIYFNMLSRYNLPEHDQLFQLDSSGDDAQPVLMFVPEGINRLDWISYFNSNPLDGSPSQTDQFGAYSQHDVNTDLQPSSGGWSTTSTLSNSISLGSHIFIVSSGLNIALNDTAFVKSAVSPTNQMSGIVIGYANTTLTLDITDVLGSGTFTNWTITQSNSIANRRGYQGVRVLPFEEFLNKMVQLDVSDSTVETFRLTINNVATGNNSSYQFNYNNNQQPQYCCIISNHFIIFNAYDNTQDSTLQSYKTMCHGWVLPTFKMEDSFVPLLDDKQFPLLLNEAKSLAFFELKQQPHQKAEKEVNRQISALQKYKSEQSIPTDFDSLPDYGRR